METNATNAQATACPTEPTAILRTWPTSKAVAAFFEDACRQIKAETGNPYVTAGINVTVGYGETVVEFCTYADGCQHVRRPEWEKAVADIIEAAGPSQKAYRMREEAAKLLAQAAMLDGFAATVLPSDVAAEVMTEGRQLPGKSTNIHE